MSTLQIPKGTLVIVADGGSARVFTNVGDGRTLQLKQEEELDAAAPEIAEGLAGAGAQ